MPVAELTDGMTATGLTVERGTAPEPFTAEFIGVIDDGIAPGIDMIVMDTDSPAIQRAGGIWAGMSGSPVYAADGRLIGAVAYGFSLAPSSIAGITPAEEMLKLLDRPGALQAQEAERAELPSGMKRQLLTSDEVSTAQAEDGLRRLPLPVAVSGLSGSRLAKFEDKLREKTTDVRAYATGAANGTATPADIVAGGNFAASLSYGDFTAAGVGTTTAVCDDYALAFGHPFLWSGKSTMSVHPANAVVVQRDDTFGSYKIANPLGPVGTLDQDRIAGIRGVLGPLPDTAAVTSTIESNDGASRDGTTHGTVPDFLPLVSSFHLLSNFDRVADFIGKGTSDLRWVISGTRADGSPFQVDVDNSYASPWDISFDSIFESWSQLEEIQFNRFENVTITGVHYSGAISDEFTRYKIQDVLLRKRDGTRAPLSQEDVVRVVTGTRLNLRVILAQDRNVGDPVAVDLSVVVPADRVGASGWVNIAGGGSGGEFEDGPGDGGSGQEPQTFDELLAQLRDITPNNSVNATLNLDSESGFIQRSSRKVVDEVVTGNFSFPIEVVADKRSLPAVVDSNVWKLRASLSSGSPTTTFKFGGSSQRQLMGDFNGDGKTSPALFRDGKWWVRMSRSSTETVSFNFGKAGDLPVVGDWNGDGRDDIGVYRQGHWYLRDAVSAGPSTRNFAFGAAGGLPVVGDWNGDGVATVGVFSNGAWKLRKYNSSGAASWAFTYGKAGDIPVAGDWNRKGRTRPGVYRAGKWILRDTLTSGSPTRNFTYGTATSRPVTWH